MSVWFDNTLLWLFVFLSEQISWWSESTWWGQHPFLFLRKERTPEEEEPDQNDSHVCGSTAWSWWLCHYFLQQLHNHLTPISLISFLQSARYWFRFSFVKLQNQMGQKQTGLLLIMSQKHEENKGNKCPLLWSHCRRWQVWIITLLAAQERRKLMFRQSVPNQKAANIEQHQQHK